MYSTRLRFDVCPRPNLIGRGLRSLPKWVILNAIVGKITAFFTFPMVYYSVYVKRLSSQDICRLFTAPFSRKLVLIERFALRTAILNDCQIYLGYI